MKKLLLIGECSNNPAVYTYVTSFSHSFEELGFEVELFNNKKNYFPLWLPKQFLLNSYIMNFLLKRKIKKNKPDVIFILKGENIFASTLALAKQCGSILYNFFPDNPFVVWNGNSSVELLKSLPLYDIFFIWSKQLMPIIKMAGATFVRYLPFGYDSRLFYKSIALSALEKAKYQSQVCFVGSWDEDRQQWLEELLQAKPDLDLAIWGDRWKDHVLQDSCLYRCLRSEAIYGERLLKVFAGSKIILNFLRAQNATSHNMRTMEVCATGAFLLTEWSHEQARELFIENEEVACFKTIPELVEKIAYYSTHDLERQKIAERGYQKVQQYTITKLLAEWLK